MAHVTDQLNTALAGRYVIERELGAGGMSLVYLARDVKHHRKVALKILRPELAAVIGAERFLKEIEVTANLQHPHILPLHDSGEAGPFLYYVMPFVEGETLRGRLQREKQLGIEESVAITRNVAAALDYAHRRGVIHRDIKPENILLHDGQPLIMDFGIALAVSQASGTRLTETGLSIGTPHYMSPEQAMGDRELDARSDVYSLGAVLYEMLAGDPPYTGSTAQAIVAKVITEKAPLVSVHRDTVPSHVAAAVARALSKLPADRFASAAEFAAALANPAFALPTGAAVVTGQPALPPSRRSALTLALAGTTALALGLAAWGWFRPDPPRSVARFVVTFPEGQRLGGLPGPDVTIAPDGSFLVYWSSLGSGTGLLHRRAIDQLTASPIPGTEGAVMPAISPDGRAIAFTGFGGLRVLSLEGGPPVSVTDSGGGHPAWGPDGMVYFQTRGTLARVPAAGGAIEPVTTSDTSVPAMAHRFPDVLPNGRGVLFTIWRGFPADADVAVVDLESGAVSVLLRGTRARYATSGHIVYTRADGALFAAPFDPDRLTVTGPATALLEGIVLEPNGSAEFSLSRNGTLVYTVGEIVDRKPVWVDRTGAERPLGADLRGDFGSPAISPDGSRIALSVATGAGLDIWIYHLAQGTLSRLTLEGSNNQYPFWSPDGRTVGFQSTREGQRPTLYQMPADGSGPATLLVQPDRRMVQEGAWLPDGRTLVFRVGPGGPTARDLHFIRPGADSAATTILETPFDETAPALSPDGRWLAYQSDESSRPEIYVRPFPGPGGRWQVSTAGGTQPRWSRSGREIFFTTAGNLVAVDVRTQPTFSAGPERTLFSTSDYFGNPSHPQYDVTPDGRRFLFLRQQAGGETQTVIVLNWIEELKGRSGR